MEALWTNIDDAPSIDGLPMEANYRTRIRRAGRSDLMRTRLGATTLEYAVGNAFDFYFR